MIQIISPTVYLVSRGDESSMTPSRFAVLEEGEWVDQLQLNILLGEEVEIWLPEV